MIDPTYFQRNPKCLTSNFIRFSTDTKNLKLCKSALVTNTLTA